jgi:hypothetical protein
MSIDKAAEAITRVGTSKLFGMATMQTVKTIQLGDHGSEFTRRFRALFAARTRETTGFFVAAMSAPEWRQQSDYF